MTGRQGRLNWWWLFASPQSQQEPDDGPTLPALSAAVTMAAMLAVYGGLPVFILKTQSCPIV